MAIHSDHLSPADLVASIDRLLAEEGEFAVLYPEDVLAQFEKTLQSKGLYFNEKVKIHSNPDSPILRVMACGSRKEKLTEERSLHIKTVEGDYSPEFIELLRPYYIIFPS
jgi:tRNA1Val (adenine37-N6)-methyltransferase